MSFFSVNIMLRLKASCFPAGSPAPPEPLMKPIKTKSRALFGLVRQDAPEHHLHPAVGGFQLPGALPHLHLPPAVRQQRRAGGRLGAGRDLVHRIPEKPEPLHLHAQHEHQRHPDGPLGLLPRPVRRAGGLPVQERDLLHPALLPGGQHVDLPVRSVRPLPRSLLPVLLPPPRHQTSGRWLLRVLLVLHLLHAHRAELFAHLKGGSVTGVFCADPADYRSD